MLADIVDGLIDQGPFVDMINLLYAANLDILVGKKSEYFEVHPVEEMKEKNIRIQNLFYYSTFRNDL